MLSVNSSKQACSGQFSPLQRLGACLCFVACYEADWQPAALLAQGRQQGARGTAALLSHSAAGVFVLSAGAQEGALIDKTWSSQECTSAAGLAVQAECIS